MPKYNEKKLTYTDQEKLMDMLCEILIRLKTKKVIKNFLKDLLNRQERVMLMRRLIIAKMLTKNCTYQEIIDRLHCSPVTIARIERWLNFGRGGYKQAVKAIKPK